MGVSRSSTWEDVPAVSLPVGAYGLPADQRPALRDLVVAGILRTCAFGDAIMTIHDAPLMIQVLSVACWANAAR